MVAKVSYFRFKSKIANFTPMSELQKTRLDKWLWAVRIFKTRSLASEACAAGKIKINGNGAKAANMVTPGMQIQVNKGGIRYVYKVLGVIEKRVGAPQAVLCYEDLTPPEEVQKHSSSFFLTFEVRDKGVGRPTKKERRDIDKFKDSEDD